MTPTELLEIEYPSSDGKPMAENTRQYWTIVHITSALDDHFANDPNVFIASDNLVYPVQFHPEICYAPDVYLAFGRPKGHRSSYRVWEEGGIFPQIIFEILSPSNSTEEMADKLAFYRRYGAEEYYVYDPETYDLEIYVRRSNGFRAIAQGRVNGFESPRLRMRFEIGADGLLIILPNGQPIQTYHELSTALAEEKQLKMQAQQAAEKEKLLKEQAQQTADNALSALEELHKKLREIGIDPATLSEGVNKP